VFIENRNLGDFSIEEFCSLNSEKFRISCKNTVQLPDKAMKKLEKKLWYLTSKVSKKPKSFDETLIQNQVQNFPQKQASTYSKHYNPH
jgi:hypothetical protein